VRRRLTSIIGVAFCAGALTGLWAARPWDGPAADEHALAKSARPSRAGSPIGSVGTYGETRRRPADGETAADPWAPSAPSSAEAGNSMGREPVAGAPPAAPGGGTAAEVDLLDRDLAMPVMGGDSGALQPSFHSLRGEREHEALDILAPKGTPVVAVEEGEIVKLFYSERGGKTIYQFEPTGRYCYYYAHLDRYASGLAEGQAVRRGQVIGYVGSTGNASAEAPHLHFAIFRLGPERRWWEGTPIDPYSVLARGPSGLTR
jgi:peptidoglycan LD-endopeptidase LytH